MIWSTPAELRSQVQKHWDSGRLLAGIVDEVAVSMGLAQSTDSFARTKAAGELRARAEAGLSSPRDQSEAALRIEPASRKSQPVEFPLRLRFRTPGPRDLAARFDEVKTWMRELEAGARDATDRGYQIIWDEVDNRHLGRNALPAGIVVPSPADAFALIGATEAAARYEALIRTTLGCFPQLGPWLRENPHAALAEVEHWSLILTVLAWFRAHPRSGLYVRQIDVPGADTKFIEVRRFLLSALLDLVLPSDAVDASCTAPARFEQRYGLAARPTMVRFRLLDRDLAIAGLTDLTARVDELARTPLMVERILIVENEITFLAFPAFRSSAVVFGGGYAVEALAGLSWLRDREVLYWGDVDTHGFAILDRLRAFLPTAGSLLMDHATLLANRELWSVEEVPFTGSLARLTREEAALYDDLRFDRLGRGVRLEQERIPFSEVSTKL